MSTIGSPESELAAAKQRIESLLGVLHRDQTGLADSLQKVLTLVNGFQWVAEGRGSYAWDDDEYRKEMSRMLDAIEEVAREGLKASGDLAHRECCGRGRFAHTLFEKQPEPLPCA